MLGKDTTPLTAIIRDVFLSSSRKRVRPFLGWGACAVALATLAVPAEAGTLESLTTTFVSNNGQSGNMFDVHAATDMTIVSLDANFDPGTLTVEIYTVAGGYQGNENNPAAWTLVASGFVTSMGTDVPTPLPFALDIQVLAGQVLGVYVTSTGGPAINYTNGLGSGIAASNADLTITEGLGVVYPFGGTYTPRVWNGTIYYYTETGTPYCFGDGTGAVCPCGNFGSGEAGCANSLGYSGRLEGAGSTSMSVDDLSLSVSGLPFDRAALLIAGSMQLNNGMGANFGDGFLCAGGVSTSLGVRFSNASGEAFWGPGLGTLGGFQAGTTTYLQVIYRDSSGGSPCGTRFNSTNGVELSVQP